MSKTNSPTLNQVMLKGTMTVYDKGISKRSSHSITDFDSPAQKVETVGIYTIAAFTPGLENYIQLIAMPSSYGASAAAIHLDPIYMTVTKIPKI